MNEQLRLLVELQKMDSKILACNRIVKSIPQKISAMDEPIRVAEDALAAARARLADMEKKKRDREMAVEDIKAKIEKARTRTSDIKDNKAYHAHLKEIETLEQGTVSIDDEVLSLMEQMEPLDTEVKAAAQALEMQKARAAEMRKSLDAEQAEARKELDAMIAERGAFVEPLEKANYDLYKKIITEVGGIAVAPIDNEICGGCYMNIMPQLCMTIRKGESIHQCPQCKRILYYEPSAPVEGGN